jgi:haloalkane dehalogenase
MRTVNVLDSSIAYREAGSGVAVVFLHGNPTSSFLWRDVLDRMGGVGHLLAPDLIGMGSSGKPAIDYTFADHARYLEAWIDAMDLDRVIFVGHDWGGALAFDWASRHPDRVAGIAFLETIVKPMSWSDFVPQAQELFKSIREPGVGEAMILDQNAFIEQLLPATAATGLTEEELNEYRRPFLDPQSRVPMLRWARSLPLDGEPLDIVARVEAYDQWLATSSDVPKLLLAFRDGPGLMITPEIVEWCEANVTALEVVEGGTAGHHAPEDRPDAIAAELRAWLERHNLTAPPTGSIGTDGS